jgi:hypothetical protein
MAIPRSTVSTWRRRGSRPVVTIELTEMDRQQLVDSIAKLELKRRILAAVVRVLLAMLRASGFTLADERLPKGAAKAGILRAVHRQGISPYWDPFSPSNAATFPSRRLKRSSPLN